MDQNIMGFITISYLFIHLLQCIADLENLQAVPHKIMKGSIL